MAALAEASEDRVINCEATNNIRYADDTFIMIYSIVYLQRTKFNNDVQNLILAKLNM